MTCNNNSSIQSKINIVGSVSGSQLTLEFIEAGHDYQKGDILRYEDTGIPSTSGFTLAKADTAENSEVVGVVREVQDDRIYLTSFGIIPVDGFTFGTAAGLTSEVTSDVYFLSGVTAGLLADTPPRESGHVIKPMLVDMGVIGGRHYAMVKNYIGNRIGGNAIGGLQNISPIGSIVPYVGSLSDVPSGFQSCNGGYIDPIIYPEYNRYIGGKFGYKVRIGLTGDDSDTFTEFIEDLAESLDGITGTSEVGRARFRQEFPGKNAYSETNDALYVIQGDIININESGQYIDVEVTPDNQLDLPALLWAEKYGHNQEVHDRHTNQYHFDDGSWPNHETGGPASACHGRLEQYASGLSDDRRYKINSAFMSNYHLSESLPIPIRDVKNELKYARNKVYRQDNRGLNVPDNVPEIIYDNVLGRNDWYDNVEVTQNADEEVLQIVKSINEMKTGDYNSYVQELESGYGSLNFGNAAGEPTRNLTTELAINFQDTLKNNSNYNRIPDCVTCDGGFNWRGTDATQPLPQMSPEAEFKPRNYDNSKPYNEREIVSYVNKNIVQPLTTEYYSEGVRTYLITKEINTLGDPRGLPYRELNKRVGGMGASVSEYGSGYTFEFATRERSFTAEGSYVNQYVANRKYLSYMINTNTNKPKISSVEIIGLALPDLRDRYLKGPLSQNDVLADKVPFSELSDIAGGRENYDNFIEKDAYDVMDNYESIGQRGGTNRTHSQKLLSVSHVSSPASHGLKHHANHLRELGVHQYIHSDLDANSNVDHRTSPCDCPVGRVGGTDSQHEWEWPDGKQTPQDPDDRWSHDAENTTIHDPYYGSYILYYGDGGDRCESYMAYRGPYDNSETEWFFNEKHNKHEASTTDWGMNKNRPSWSVFNPGFAFSEGIDGHQGIPFGDNSPGNPGEVSRGIYMGDPTAYGYHGNIIGTYDWTGYRTCTAAHDDKWSWNCFGARYTNGGFEPDPDIWDDTLTYTYKHPYADGYFWNVYVNDDGEFANFEGVTFDEFNDIFSGQHYGPVYFAGTDKWYRGNFPPETDHGITYGGPGAHFHVNLSLTNRLMTRVDETDKMGYEQARWNSSDGFRVIPKQGPHGSWGGYQAQGLVFGDDGLYNTAGYIIPYYDSSMWLENVGALNNIEFMKWNYECASPTSNWHGDMSVPDPEKMTRQKWRVGMMTWNRDRYSRVDTPGIVTDTVWTPRESLDMGVNKKIQDTFNNHRDYQVIDRVSTQYSPHAGNSADTFGVLRTPGQWYNPLMGIDEDWASSHDNGKGEGEDTEKQLDHRGPDYYTAGYITNEPKYFSVYYLVRVSDDIAIGMVDDMSFMKITADGLQDDGVPISGSESPLTLKNLPGSSAGLSTGAVYLDGDTLKVVT